MNSFNQNRFKPDFQLGDEPIPFKNQVEPKIVGKIDLISSNPLICGYCHKECNELTSCMQYKLCNNCLENSLNSI